ncbi:phospholipid phosphatase 2-like isoform X2 [Saimiri boliviensis]
MGENPEKKRSENETGVACLLDTTVCHPGLSFYSGHTSFRMYFVVFLALYMQAQLCWKWARLLHPTVQFFLVAFALYVGYTRMSDHKHHWSDVLTGLLKGALVAGLTALFLSLPTWDPVPAPPAHAHDPGACPAPAQSHLPPFCQVSYISDIFKARPPQHCPKEEELEQKPSLSLTVTLGEADHNHYGYPHSSS